MPKPDELLSAWHAGVKHLAKVGEGGFHCLAKTFAVGAPQRSLIGAFDLDLRSLKGLTERSRFGFAQFSKSCAARIERLEQVAYMLEGRGANRRTQY